MYFFHLILKVNVAQLRIDSTAKREYMFVPRVLRIRLLMNMPCIYTNGLNDYVKATPHNAIKEKDGEQPTRKQLEALLNLFARQQQIKPSDRVCQRGSDLPMRAGYSLLQFAFASLGIVSFGIEAGASKPQRHVRLWHEPKISHARAA